MAPNTKRVFYVKYLPSAVFPTVLAKRPDVQLDKLENESPNDQVVPILSQAHVYQIGASRQIIAPHFQVNAALLARTPNLIAASSNGAGYDTWMGSLLGADGGSPRVVNAATVLHITGSDPNPHLWYDIPRVPTVAAAIAGALEKAAPGDAPTFKSNLSTFDASLAPLDATLATIKAHFHNVPVAYTERVPGYALAVADLDVKTPPGFARAIEDGTDPGPADTLAMQKLLTDHDINVLLYNVQTVTPVTTQIRALARSHDIPVVGVSETMPAGVATYQQWQQSQLTNLLHALESSRNP